MNKKIVSILLTFAMLTGMSMAVSVNAEKLPANGPSKDVTDNVFKSLPSDLEKEKGNSKLNTGCCLKKKKSLNKNKFYPSDSGTHL